ncbi:MAG TPA: protein translocase subunit SecD [Candidatus Paceibacterota bacterium]|nr:protein translocase subunit SecD [Candidatus Paceibacterota bacterium]HRZ34715.1 protein translocase subunit SecD [Candidatus Paceibacterota bacterium]
MSKVRISAVILVLMALAAGWFVYNSEVNSTNDRFTFKLGLDLNGGTHLTYRADVTEIATGDINDAMSTLRSTIERRVNIFGVSEPIVQVERGGIFSENSDDYRLIVDLPGVTDIAEAIKQIGATPVLEFRLAKTPEELADFPSELSTSTAEMLAQIREMYEPTGLTGAQLNRASLSFDDISGEASVSLDYNGEGRELLSDITSNNVGRVMAIFLDGVMISNPVIRDSITTGQAVISGSFTTEEARELVKNLNFGALPVPIELVETQTIGATLGLDTLNKGIEALLVGFIAILIFMTIWYRLPGFISAIALSFYIVLMLLLFKLIPVTLTAAGLAGFILSIGMAVDANVLIFERIREELQKNISLYDAIKTGSDRAWSSIRDGNFTSIISAVVLYWMSGTSLVKGFALVFGLGVIASMLTAIVVSKILLLALSSKNENLSPDSFFRKLFGCGLRSNRN